MVKIVFELKKENIDFKTELKKTQEEIKKTKTVLTENKEDILTRIEKLEENQKLMYYLISMYHSKDI